MRRIHFAVILGFCVQALCAGAACAQNLEIPPIFSSGMVLQQQADVTLWGRADAGAEVSVKTTWTSGKLRATAGEDGKWHVKVATPQAGYDPQTIEFKCGKETVELTDVLIGDVWFLGGQSNMQMDFRGNPDQPTENAQRILSECTHKGIRLFRVNNGYSLEPSDTLDTDAAWTYADPENVKKFSVVGYVFGERIHSFTDIPIGLVLSAHGGSVAEAWLDRDVLEEFGEFDLDLKQEEMDPIWYAMDPMVLYNKMLAPMLPLTVKGIIWYQGESNVSRPEQYSRLFPLLIDTWRTKYFKNPDLPFFYVQIAPHEYQDGSNSAELREVQLKTMDKVANTGMAVTLDVGERNVIHPAKKEVVGERLSYWALNKVYGQDAIECRGPEFKSMEVKNGHAYLKFDYAPNGLSFFGNEPEGFEVAGEDRVFHPAKARIVPSFWGNEGLEVWSDEVPEPVAVRYGYTNYVKGTLYNNAGLPASSFRTDNW